MSLSRTVSAPARLAAAAILLAAAAGCGGDNGIDPVRIEVGSVTVDQAPFQIERGYHHSLTATVRDRQGDTIDVPVVWRSSNEAVVQVDANGRVTAIDAGSATITASTLGVASQPLPVRVVWQGAAAVALHQFEAPGAATPGVEVPAPIQVRVTNSAGSPVGGVKVRFSVASGGGSLSATLDTTDAAGIASSRLTLGPGLGANTVQAEVLSDDDTALGHVTGNPLRVTITTFAALQPTAGTGQTAPILSKVPVAPAVRVMDAAGSPRPGVPVSFAPTAGGRVTTPVASTDANGVASPGEWTLGDEPGEQSLVVTVESARYTFTATATGTPILYTPPVVVAGGFVTCAIRSDARVECMGEQPKVGDSTSVNRATPTLTRGNVTFTSIAAGPGAISGAFTVGVAHLCGIGTDAAMYCWGLFALTDSSDAQPHALRPTRVPTDIRWSQAAPGLVHNCGLTDDGTAYCWGDNSSGQLGDRTDSARNSPVAVAGGFRFGSITSGSYHSCGLSLGGSAFCWGLNRNGQVGDASTTNRMDPTAVAGGVTFQSLGAGESLTCGLGTSGRAWCWGALSSARPRQATPYEYANAPPFTSLTVGGGHACGLAADGRAYCWGNNAAGQLGDSTTTYRNDPTPVAGTLRFTSLSAGYLHTCGSTTDAAVACWGLNRAGELGDSTIANRLVPRRIVLGVNP